VIATMAMSKAKVVVRLIIVASSSNVWCL
jgi:hypothetical protein